MHKIYSQYKNIKLFNFISAGNSRDFIIENGEELEFYVLLYDKRDVETETSVYYKDRENGFGNGFLYGDTNGAIIAYGDGSGDGSDTMDIFNVILSVEGSNA